MYKSHNHNHNHNHDRNHNHSSITCDSKVLRVAKSGIKCYQCFSSFLNNATYTNMNFSVFVCHKSGLCKEISMK